MMRLDFDIRLPLVERFDVVSSKEIKVTLLLLALGLVYPTALLYLPLFYPAITSYTILIYPSDSNFLSTKSS